MEENQNEITGREYRDLLDTETRVSILYAFYLKGRITPETVSTVMGWDRPVRHIEDGHMD